MRKLWLLCILLLMGCQEELPEVITYEPDHEAYEETIEKEKPAPASQIANAIIEKEEPVEEPIETIEEPAVMVAAASLGEVKEQVIEIKHQSYELGAPAGQYDYIQGITVDNDTIYSLDGTTFKAMKHGAIKEYYDLYELMPQLQEHGFHEEEIIHTFKLTYMDKINNKLYAIGFLFDYMEDEGLVEEEHPVHRGSKILGESYVVLFQMQKGKARILHLEKAHRHWAYEFDSWFETSDGMPTDYFQWGDNILYAYFKNVEWPRFTYQDGALVFNQPRQNQKNTPPYTDFYVIKNGVKEMIYTHQAPEYEYTLPVLKGTTLTIYMHADIQHINLATGEIKNERYPSDYYLKRPRYKDGEVYFLNNKGIFTIKRLANGRVEFPYLLEASDVDIESLFISGYDIEDDIYVADFYRRSVHQIKP